MRGQSIIRVPEEWAADPNREATEQALRLKNLKPFPQTEKLKCPACWNCVVKVWFDRAYCVRCHLYIKLEGAEGWTVLPRVESIKPTEMENPVCCLTCKRNQMYLWRDKITCAYCRVIGTLSAAFTHYWALQEIVEKKKLPYKTSPHMSRTSIYRKLKEQQQEGA